MSRIRNTWIHDSNGNPILVDADGRVEVSVGDSTGAEWLLNNGGMPVNLRDGSGTSWDQDANGGMPVNSKLYDDTGTPWLLESNGAMPVNIQDQTSRAIILPLVQQLGSTTNSVEIVGDGLTRTLTVADSTGMIAGQHIRVIDATNNTFWSGGILNVVANVITVDTPFDDDITYPIGSQVTFSNADLGVDGSVTPVSFKLRTGNPSIPSLVDITRIILTCTTNSAVDLNNFGDLPALSVGLIFRLDTADPYTLGNAKTNKDLAGFAYDFTPWVASNPGQGIDGFTMRMTFAGQNKIGVALRVDSTENIEIVVQDDLTGLVTFNAIVEGHLVTN